AAALTYLQQALAAASEYEGEDWGGGGLRAAAGVSLGAFLAMTAALIEQNGWVSRKVAYECDKVATATDAALYSGLSGRIPEELRKHIPEVTDAHRADADAAIEWAL